MVNRLAVFREANVGEQYAIRYLSSMVGVPPFSDPGAMLCQNRVKRRGTAGMYAGNRNFVPLGLLRGTDHHFVRYRVGKQDQKIRASQLLPQRAVFFCEYFGFAAIVFADIGVLTFHSFVSTYNHNTHIGMSSFDPAKVSKC
jgi:hypothetical protein